MAFYHSRISGKPDLTISTLILSVKHQYKDKLRIKNSYQKHRKQKNKNEKDKENL